MGDEFKVGRIVLASSDHRLVTGFNWAKKQALDYVHWDDPVGKWYEAALPGRGAFCMRDVSHQSMGAHILGLEGHTKNMLKKFAENISDSKDWCSYWEINREDLPAPIDYKSDSNFWYNLPANFDVLQCCLKQYQWTGDRDYIEDPLFLNFYNRTVDDFVKRWDASGDGLLEHQGTLPHRGIASYLEGQIGKKEIRTASDLIAAQYAGYAAYATIMELNDEFEKSYVYQKKANALRHMFNDSWWNKEQRAFYTAHFKDGTTAIVPESKANQCNELVTPLPLYFKLVETGHKSEAAIGILLACESANVETKSHFPEVLFQYGYNEAAYQMLMTLVDPELKRREYPEVSYSVMGNILNGLVGICPDAAERLIETKPRLPKGMGWISVKHVPIFGNEISIDIVNDGNVIFRNSGMVSVIWKPTFRGEFKALMHNGARLPASQEIGEDGHVYSYCKITVEGGRIHTVCRGDV